MATRYPYFNRLFAIPNGGKRSPKTAKRLKAEGVRRGVPDLMWPHYNGEHYGLWIEMKKEKGSYPTAEQKEWLAYLNSVGYLAVVCRGFDEAKQAMLDYSGAEDIYVSW